MIARTGGRPIFLATGTTDLRKSFTGLYALIHEQLRHEPLSGAIFGFCNRRRDTMKFFFYDQGGFWVCAKRLEDGRATGCSSGTPMRGRGSRIFSRWSRTVARQAWIPKPT
jgi:transposase